MGKSALKTKVRNKIIISNIISNTENREDEWTGD